MNEHSDVPVPSTGESSSARLSGPPFLFSGSPIAFALLLLVLIMACQGRRGIWDPDEGRYCAAALQMIRHNDYLHIQLHPEHPHYAKPPLTYWLIAAGFRAFGRNAFAARLPNSLAFWATCLLLWHLGRRVIPGREWLAPLVHATSVLPAVAAHLATTDTILTFMEVLAVSSFLFAQEAQSGRRRHACLALMWLGFGLAFLTKGPPGLLPLLPIIVYSWIRDGFRKTVLVVVHPGLIVFAVVGLGWFWAVIRSRPELFDYFLKHEVMARVTSDVHDQHPEWYGALLVYVPVIVLGSLPWTVPVLKGTARILPFLRRATRVNLARTDPMGLFMILWFLLPLVVLSCAKSRLPLYFLPFYPPVALLIAKSIGDRALAWGKRKRALLLAWCLVLVGARVAAAHIPLRKDCRIFARAIREQVTAPFDELTFIDAQPRYGLALYLDCEMERIAATDSEPLPYRFHYQTLREELEGPEQGQRRLFVVKDREEQRFVDTARTLGYKAAYQGGWHYYRLYLLSKSSESRQAPGG